MSRVRWHLALISLVLLLSSSLAYSSDDDTLHPNDPPSQIDETEPTVSNNETSTLAAAKPNRSVIVDGLGRLPQFSHATVAGDLIFVSGTLGTQGASFDLAPDGTGPETTQTLKNIETILREAGAELSDIVKVSVYLADMDSFREMNKAYSEFFGDEPPARITVGGAGLALGAAVEIECIARIAPN